jgi:hypothetical protein
MAELKKLNREQWTQLDTLVRNVPDPNETYTATGWHYQLAALLGSFDIRVMGRQDAYRTGKNCGRLYGRRSDFA